MPPETAVVVPEARNDEEFEVVMPAPADAVVAEGEEEEPEAETPLPRAAAPVSAAPAAPAVSATVPAAAVPTPTPPAQAPLSPAAREERNKRKMLAAKYAQVLTERDRALAQLDQRSQDQRPEAVIKLRAELVKKANDADSMGTLLGIAIEELDRVDRVWQERMRTHEVMTNIRLSDVNARLRYSDYDKVLKDSGITAALSQTNGQFQDPYLAKQVYLSADPGEEAYQLAKGKLEHERLLKGEDEETPVPSQPAEVPGAPAAPAAPAATVVADAERRGAQRVVEVVTKNAERPRGVRGLRTAGGGESGKYTRKQLDSLMETNPTAYERLVAANVGLERWHLGG